MSTRCEKIGKYVLPLFRSYVAKELINNYDLTQVETAKKLGTTQAAISQYINSKRAQKGKEQINKILPQIREWARTTAKRLANDELPPDEVSVCKLCLSFFEAQSN
jgi:predicted transcriptional regulator